MKQKVLISILTQDTVHWKLSSQLAKIVALNRDRYQLILDHSKNLNVDNNRNKIVERFLKEDFDWLLMIDEDNPPNADPLDLIELDKDVMILPTPMFNPEKDAGILFNVFKEVGNELITLTPDLENKLVRIDSGGSGCILIRRNVLESIKRPFESKWDKKGIRQIGSDVLFCMKAKKRGFEIWTHWDYICSHYKTINLLDVAEILARNNR